MVDVTENMLKTCARKARENSAFLGGILLLSWCSYFLVTQYKKRKKAVIVVSRYPEAGKAKTRMIPFLGEAGAAQLQVVMTEHILKVLKRYEAVNKDTDVTLQYTGGSNKQMKYWLDRKIRGMQCFYRQQRGDNLGEKLKSAISDSFNGGHEYVVVIGADIPGINEGIIDSAFKLLQNRGTDMVLGKAEDGGYYLIGLHKSSKKYLDKLFDNIDWGTSHVFKQQLDQATSVGASPEILPVVLEDVDTIDDIKVFEKEVGLPVDQLKTIKWSIVIPVFNEEKTISTTLKNIRETCSDMTNLLEIIISDGGSKDNTVDVIEHVSKSYPVPVKVINTKPGRGQQLIEGVEATSGHYLLFLHADTRLPQNFDKIAASCLQRPGVVAGAFEFQLDVLADEKLRSEETLCFLFQMHLLAWGTKQRGRKNELPYGDQGLFMSKIIYKEVGGFPPYPLMEDYILVEKLKTVGHVDITEGYPVMTSYRRWKKWGPIRITAFNQMIILAYKCGITPNTLAKWYYGKKTT